jgi:hypothetical protein
VRLYYVRRLASLLPLRASSEPELRSSYRSGVHYGCNLRILLAATVCPNFGDVPPLQCTIDCCNRDSDRRSRIFSNTHPRASFTFAQTTLERESGRNRAVVQNFPHSYFQNRVRHGAAEFIHPCPFAPSFRSFKNIRIHQRELSLSWQQAGVLKNAHPQITSSFAQT